MIKRNAESYESRMMRVCVYVYEYTHGTDDTEMRLVNKKKNRLINAITSPCATCSIVTPFFAPSFFPFFFLASFADASLLTRTFLPDGSHNLRCISPSFLYNKKNSFILFLSLFIYTRFFIPSPFDDFFERIKRIFFSTLRH